ncbi:MAG: hypothetical protein VR72_21950 [Clostridiaceae bacterium BRH_c20a]|nr:MAG: hypothetical protein VR72_21950 [Clostridiaceae bacterium BRH_c20a]
MLLELVNLAILLGIGYLSALVSAWIKIPAGRLIGPILVVAALNIIGFNIKAPTYLVVICSIIFGVFIGLKFNRKTLEQLRSVIIPGTILVGWYILITFVYGWVLLNTSLLDKYTAFLSVLPGGIAEVSVLALSYNADISQIVSFQLARLLTIIMIVPVLVKRVFVYNGEHYCEQREAQEKEQSGHSLPINNNWWVYFVIATIGSIIFTMVHFPAGRLIGALIFTAAYNFSPPIGDIPVIKNIPLLKRVCHLSSDKVTTPPVKYYNFAQIGMGSIIGTSFSRESFLNISESFFPIVIITFLVIFNSLILSLIFSKIFKWDLLTGFLSIIPGGLAPMVLIADQVKADVVVVSSLQLLRLLTAILVIPILYSFLL